MEKKPKKLNKFGKLPINARITIDYSGKKPKVSFGYIAAKQQRSLNYINLFSLGIMALFSIILVWIFVYVPNYWDEAPYTGTCAFYEQHELGDNHVTAYNITCGPVQNYLFKYQAGKGLFPLGTKSGFVGQDTSKLSDYTWLLDTKGKPWYYNVGVTLLVAIFAILFYAGIMVVLFGGSYVIGWGLQFIPFANKKVNKWIPEINARLSSARYMVVFKECPQDKVLEIPLFKNVFLDYDAKGEFSKYLLRVEVREHPFTMISKRYFFKNRRQKQNYKKKKNVFLWKARFIFKEVPKRGQLEVRWA